MEPHLILVLTVIGLILALTFVVQLGRHNWRANPAGKSTMALSVVIVLALGLAVARYSGFGMPEWVRAVVFIAIDVALLGRVIAYVATARAAERSGTGPDEPARTN